MAEMLVGEVRVDGNDTGGSKIAAVYSKVRDLFAIYLTRDGRVMVHFADDPVVAQAQCDKIAPLNPLRGDIGALIDGWHCSKDKGLNAKARHLDRRVADALAMALDGDAANALASLEAIQADIIADRKARARFQYLLVALGTAAAICVLIWLISWIVFRARLCAVPPLADGVWQSVMGGTLGAFFSIATGLQKRTILTDLQKLDNACDAALRIVIGVIGAVIIIFIFQTGLAGGLSIDKAVLNPTEPKYDWMLVFVVAFCAGFSERLVPDLLTKVQFGGTPGASDGTPAKVPPVPAPPAGGGGAGAAAAPAGGAPAAAAAAPAIAEAPRDDDGDDSCPCDAPPTDEEATPDEDLPVANGGVQPPVEGA
jgi:hypothetical protein